MSEEQNETRTYEPPEEFASQANVSDASVYETAANDYEAFWAERARELHWFKDFDTVLDWNPPDAQWFIGASPTSLTTVWIIRWSRATEIRKP